MLFYQYSPCYYRYIVSELSTNRFHETEPPALDVPIPVPWQTAQRIDWKLRNEDAWLKTLDAGLNDDTWRRKIGEIRQPIQRFLVPEIARVAIDRCLDLIELPDVFDPNGITEGDMANFEHNFLRIPPDQTSAILHRVGNEMIWDQTYPTDTVAAAFGMDRDSFAAYCHSLTSFRGNNAGALIDSLWCGITYGGGDTVTIAPLSKLSPGGIQLVDQLLHMYDLGLHDHQA